MVLIIIIALVGLIVLHEFGHFILAKKFGVKVEEFGVGYPPRLFGRKFGETLYSLNLIPFGAFVKIQGEIGGLEDYRSFSGKPIYQRVLIVLGGVVSFWIVAAVIMTLIAGVWGLPTIVGDEENKNLVDPKVNILTISAGSPAEASGLKVGDIILSIGYQQETIEASKIKDVQEFIGGHKEKEINLLIKRGNDTLEKKVFTRSSPPDGQGPIGVGLARMALKQYPWYLAPVQGITATVSLTLNVVQGWIVGIKSALGLAKLPQGVKMEMMGPVGIFSLLSEYYQLGINYFLYLVALISVALALTNILPIPSLDGGKLLFLAIEKIKGKPIDQKIEQNVTAAFFALLIVFIIFITIKFDIPRLGMPKIF